MTTDQHIDRIVKEAGLPYLDVCAYKEHRLIYRYFTGKNVTGNEMLWMYSCTKPLTVSLAMRLWEEGRLSLSAPVSDYLPEFKEVFLLTDGVPCAPKNPVTVWHLFTMSAGFTYDVNTDAIRTTVEKPGEPASTREVVAAMVKSPISFEPGDRFQYSLCHDILAAVIEVCAGERFSDYAKHTVFEPIGMESCRFRSESVNFAPQYNVINGKIVQIPVENGLIVTKNYESGGAGLISNLSDYAKFADTLACGGTAANGYRLLKEETLRRIKNYESLKYVHPESFGCIQGDGYAYGLGVRVRNKPTEWGLLPGEFGWDGAAGSYLMADPNKQISVVMGMHLLGWPAVFRGKHLEITEDIYRNCIQG